MMKVEAVVVRDRVETVMEAVEAETGHVGVTVIEAVGHGREKGITHEYRGRVFESRFLPKALMTFIVRDELAEDVIQRSRTPRGRATQTATGSAGCRPSAASPTTGPAASSRRWRAYEHQGARDCDEHGLGRRRRGARPVHAGRVRVPRGRADADEERRSHRGEERPRARARRDHLLPRRVRARIRRRRQRHRRRQRVRAVGRRRCSRSAPSRSRGSQPCPASAAFLFQVAFAAVSLAIVWGAMAERTKLWVYFAFGIAFTVIYSVVSHWIWSPDGWLFAKGMQDFAGLDRRPLPGRPRRAGRCAPARPAHRQVRRRQAAADPGPQHGVRHARRPDPLVRLVRLQRRARRSPSTSAASGSSRTSR